MKSAVAFGQVLRRLRGEVGYSQAKLGIEANLWRNFIGMLERGERQPTLSTIFKLAKALNCSASELVRLAEVEVRSESEDLSETDSSREKNGIQKYHPIG